MGCRVRPFFSGLCSVMAVAVALAGGSLTTALCRAADGGAPAATTTRVAMATSREVRVAGVRLPATTRTSSTGVTPPPQLAAYVVNVSDHPVRVWVPGLVGPNTGPSEPPVDYRVSAGFGPDDYVVLRPGEFIGRVESALQGRFRPEAEIGAYYLFFTPGHEGEFPGKGVLNQRGNYYDATQGRRGR